MMPSNSPDSHKISLKIIEAIKQHPVLYVSEVKGNTIKLQEFRQKVWKRISDELGLDPSWVKLKWKNLRDTYCRILKYKNKTNRGIRRKKWIFEDHLSFLKFPYESNYEAQYVELTEEYINDINTEVISSQDLLEQLEDNDIDDDYREYLEVLEEGTNLEDNQAHESLESSNDNISSENNDNQTLQKLAIDAYAKEIQSKFRKIRPKEVKIEESNVNKFTPILLKAPSIISIQKPVITQNVQNVEKVTKLPTPKQSYDQNQSVDQFFNSIAQAVKKLPPKAQADIKMDICNIISEAEITHCKKSIPQTVKKYANMPGMIPKLVLVPCKVIDGQN